jgi:hypothetical protein
MRATDATVVLPYPSRVFGVTLCASTPSCFCFLILSPPPPSAALEGHGALAASEARRKDGSPCEPPPFVVLSFPSIVYSLTHPYIWIYPSMCMHPDPLSLEEEPEAEKREHHTCTLKAAVDACELSQAVCVTARYTKQASNAAGGTLRAKRCNTSLGGAGGQYL